MTTPQFKAAAGGMADIGQWFPWRLEWDASKGKFSKQPSTLDGSRYPVDASSPTNWNDFDAVRDAVKRLDVPGASVRYAMGFYLTPSAGYVLVDIDHALGPDGQWLPIVDQLCAEFSGAMVERSSSGHGVHIIASRAGKLSKHRNKPNSTTAAALLPVELELYGEARGIAFGLDGEAIGCADASFDFAPLVARYFPPGTVVDASGERRAEWRGPSDDEELIRRMLAARISADAAFNGKASLSQLWNGEAEKNSNTDAALASHLAFWTGCDAERMTRLMWRSGLVRPKWREHRTYLPTTISNACAACSAVYQERRDLPLPPVQRPAGTAPMVRNAADLQRAQFMPIQWALQDLLPEGVTILSSDPKLGKSWMVYAWCIAIATGKAIWDGRAAEQQGKALLLALEDNDRRMRRRLDKLLPTFGNPPIDRLFYSCDWPRGEAGVAAIREFLVANPSTRIVVIDTIAAFRNTDPGRKNAYSWDYEVGALLKPLSQEFQCAFVLVSHNRKSGAGDTHVNQEVSGTTGLVGGVDNVFVLKRSSGNVTAVLHTDGRDIEQQLELALQLHDGRWACIGDAKDVNRSQQRNSVLEALNRAGGVGTARDIHEAMGATEKLSTLRVRLSRMVAAGELNLSGRLYSRAHPETRFAQLLTPPPMPGVSAQVVTPDQGV